MGTVYQVVRHLLTLDLSAEKQKTKKKTAMTLRIARWETLAAFAQSTSRVLREQLQSQSDLVLHLAVQERFETREVLAAMAQCVVALASDADHARSLLDVKQSDDNNNDREADSVSYLVLLKQMYVTLPDAALRRSLGASLSTLIASKEHVKMAVRAGVLRAVLQVANDASNTQADLMQNCADVLSHVATLVCFGRLPPTQRSDEVTAPDSSSELLVCECVVALLLSSVSVVFQEGVRLLQMLVENPRLCALVVSVADLRGALEKAHTLAQQHENNTAARGLDPDVVTLARQQFDQLRPAIDALERTRGVSLVGLPPDRVPDTRDATTDRLDTALVLATHCKEQGNAYFKRGNFPTARAFYLRAISLLSMAQRAREQQLAALSPADVLRQCSAGASVQVQSRPDNSGWRNAMVADVESGLVEVIFDDDGTEAAVDPSRVRLRLTTSVLDAYEALEADCAMNMGKAFAQLHDYERAIESFSHALTVKRDKLAAALYHRGVAFLALHDLKSAQQDLWRANELARKAGDTVLAKLVSAAYKKLQALHATKKRMDKRVVKEMMRYLSTVMPSGDAEFAVGKAE